MKTPNSPVQRKIPENTQKAGESYYIVAPAGGHVVQNGETLFSIARMYGTSYKKIMEANNIGEGGSIMIGQKLKIPQDSVQNLNVNKKVEVASVEKQSHAAIPSNGIHIVKQGDTLFAIARLYGVGAIDLASENGVDLGYMVRIGEKLKVPAKSSPIIEGDVATKKDVVQNVTNIDAKVRDKIGSRKIDCSLNFGWPLYSTEILYGYGETLPNGTKADGVIISSEEGKNITASYSGEVAYAGNDIPEYGNLMIIKHSDSWMTIYGNMSGFTKKVGDKVTKGDLIGTVGRTGQIGLPSLYFSIRKVKTPYNPELCI